MAEKRIILDRIKEYFLLKNNKDLADFLGVSKQTISNWYSRDTVDYEIIISKCTDIDPKIDLKWLLCGMNGDSDWDISRFQKRDSESEDTQFDNTWLRLFEKHSTDRLNTINLMLEKINYSERAAKTEELISYIGNIVDYIKENSIDYNLNKLYQSQKKNEISMDDIEGNLYELKQNDIKLYNMLFPYQRELKALNALIFTEDMGD